MDEAQQQGVEAAIERAVLITISGNDHAKTKAQAAPFHLFRNGIVTVSCTGAIPRTVLSLRVRVKTHRLHRCAS